eukprot:gene7592-10341_t
MSDLLLDYSSKPIWFIHPSDATLLTSFIKQEDPCLNYGKGEEFLHNRIQMIVLLRSKTRAFENHNNVLLMLQKYHTENHIYDLSDLHTNYYDFQIASQNSNYSYNDNNNHYNKTNLKLKQLNNNNNNNNNNNRNNKRSKTNHHYSITSSGMNIFATFFENKSFIDQMKIMSDSDIILTIHGAGLTNLAFMKPCSVVIEIFPFAFNIPHYFGGLARKSGIIHFSWQESLRHTHYDLTVEKVFLDCLYHINIATIDTLEYITFGTYANNNNNNNSNSTPLHPIVTTENKHDILSELLVRAATHFDNNRTSHRILSELCFTRANCRKCTREAVSLSIDRRNMFEFVTKAVNARAKCLLNHPFYNKNNILD